MAVACSSSTPAQNTTTTTEAPSSNAAPDAAPASETSFRVVYGLMTFVMDSPSGQEEKARRAVEESALLAGLRATGATVETQFDKDLAGDDVVILGGDGTEIARVSLHDLEEKDVYGPALDKAQASLAR